MAAEDVKMGSPAPFLHYFLLPVLGVYEVDVAEFQVSI